VFKLGLTFLVAILISISTQLHADMPPDLKPQSESKDLIRVTKSLYELQVHVLDGKPVDLGKYRGHVTLVVNTASHCGFTPQYAGLEKLYQDYEDRGMVILGFPSNDFGGQEPGTPQEIATFCSTTYHVTFPMFEKVVTKGPGQSPVYQFLTTGFPAPTWNFCKYLIDKNGKVLQEFPSAITPESKELRGAIDAALKG
jgi:glutathione peroxidase